jgi:archaellum component FlaC
MRRRSFAVLALAVAFVAGSVGACSSDSESPKEAACSDADTLKDSVNQLIEDVKSGNFGDAKDQLSTVKSDFEALESSAKDLASSKRASVQADLDEVKGTLGELTSAASLDDVEATLGKAESELKDTADSIRTTLSC